MIDSKHWRSYDEERSRDGEGGKRDLPMEPVKKVEFDGDLITYATRDSILLAVLGIVDGDTRIKRERSIILVETHESA